MKKVLFTMLMVLGFSMLFAQSYDDYLAKAKAYESKKQWCWALDAYYDAMAADISPELKEEAYKGYKELSEAIKGGNPGYGNYNQFTMHDAWKALLIEAEQYACTYNTFTVTVGKLVQGALDYSTKTATYSAKISYTNSDRYDKTVALIETGYKNARKSDWDDLPASWPKESASNGKNNVFKMNGAYIYKEGSKYYNAFALPKLMDIKFNIVDVNGKEIQKGKRVLLGAEDTFTVDGITPDIMDMIDNGNAFLNPVACYLQYGEYNKADDKGGRTFIKNFPEVQLPMDKSVFICWNNKTDIKANVFEMCCYYGLGITEDIEGNLIKIDGKSFAIGKTEITQQQYIAVMGENPSRFKGDYNPVESVSWYDAIYFCNKLSKKMGYTSVYSVNGSTDVTEWGYTPHEGNRISGNITQDTSANGFRLPTEEEWEYAAKGGQNYTYSGSNTLSDVGWYSSNSGDKTHPVAQKKANGYGLYDMSGNVWEWCWDAYSGSYRYYRGGSYYYCDGNYCQVSRWSYDNTYYSDPNYRNNSLGFRIVRSTN